MTVGTLSPQQLRSLVEDKWQRDEDAVAVGLHVTTSWLGPGEVEFDFGKAQVVRADTVFQVREALLDAERNKGRIILLTKLQQADLGHDVVARLARSRLFAIDHWASLCALFKAKELDRSICDPAIAQALLEYAPPDGYPPVSAGILDAGTVWRAISRHVFEMGESEPDLVSLLLWATTKSGSARYLNACDGTAGQPACSGWWTTSGMPPTRSCGSSRAVPVPTPSPSPSSARSSSGTARTRRSKPPPPGWSSTTTTSRSRRRSADAWGVSPRMPLPIWTAGKIPGSPSSTSSEPTNCSGSSAARITPTATG